MPSTLTRSAAVVCSTRHPRVKALGQLIAILSRLNAEADPSLTVDYFSIEPPEDSTEETEDTVREPSMQDRECAHIDDRHRVGPFGASLNLTPARTSQVANVARHDCCSMSRRR